MEHDDDGALPTITVDERSSRAPMAICALRRALRNCRAGQNVLLLATDPATEKAVADFTVTAGLALLSVSEHKGEFRFCIRK